MTTEELKVHQSINNEDGVKIDNRIIFSLSESFYDDIKLRNEKDFDKIIDVLQEVLLKENEYLEKNIGNTLESHELEALKVINTVRNTFNESKLHKIVEYLETIHNMRKIKLDEHKKRTKIDTLVEDPPIPNQTWVLVSFISPEKIKMKSTMRAIKIRGTFSTKESADEYAKKLRQDVEGHFDIYAGEVGKWLPWDSAENVEDNDYAEKELNRLVKNHKEHLDKSRMLHFPIPIFRYVDAATLASSANKSARKRPQTLSAILVCGADKGFEQGVWLEGARLEFRM